MTIRLAREVRFSLVDATDESGSARNSWMGCPASDRLDAFLALRAVVRGRVDPRTGYLCDIQTIDACLRRHAVAFLIDAVLRDPRRPESSAGRATDGSPSSRSARTAPSIAAAMPGLWSSVSHAAPPEMHWESLTLHAGPQLSFSIRGESLNMVRLTCAFEFSAAHRLHCPTMSADENHRLFGKCANPNGHGHNYVLEVTVRGAPDPVSGAVVPLDKLIRVVNERVIERFDHKHLNLDCPEFAALNPSVENIARVIFDLLKDEFLPAQLDRVCVHETPKTRAECSADD